LYIVSSRLHRYIELEKIARGMGSKRIHPEQLADIEIPLPSIDDQRLYISKFKIIENSTDTVNNELSNQLDLLKKLRQQILQDAVQGKLVQQDPNDEPANKLLGRIIADKEKLVREKKIKKEKPLPPIKPEEIPFTIPANWVWCRFSDIALIETNLVDPFKYPNLPHIAPDNIEKGTGKLLDYKTVKEDNIISANHYFFPSQLIYSKVRPRLNKVVKVSFEGLCSADMYPLKSLINPDYLLYCMLSDYFLSEVNRFDNRVKMPKINQNQLSLILFPLPPLPEQERIITKIKSSLEICEVLEQTIQENQKFTKDLLQVALKEALEPKTY
jgi:type I restriction enzyme S subunit